MASRLNNKLPVFLARARDPKAYGVDALVSLWQDFSLLYVFPPFPLLPKVLRKIEAEGIPTVLIAPEWPRRAWFSDVAGGRPMASSRQTGPPVSGPALPPEFTVSSFNGVAVETAILKRGFSDSVIRTMIRARKSASSRIYYRTWKAFLSFCESSGFPPLRFSIPMVLSFLQSGLEKGLSLGGTFGSSIPSPFASLGSQFGPACSAVGPLRAFEGGFSEFSHLESGLPCCHNFHQTGVGAGRSFLSGAFSGFPPG
ncbi:uncharacterized protein LOC121008982 [Bufo bufo]|uniref:uncharacterized protein LOC121008982 n=1 Tax=Bufo bufo TaxID=8384 RepID=UPI001ABE9166|nr:uncharacterized protein LOC121008982 [Bufo bufo]